MLQVEQAPREVGVKLRLCSFPELVAMDSPCKLGRGGIWWEHGREEKEWLARATG